MLIFWGGIQGWRLPHAVWHPVNATCRTVYAQFFARNTNTAAMDAAAA